MRFENPSRFFYLFPAFGGFGICCLLVAGFLWANALHISAVCASIIAWICFLIAVTVFTATCYAEFYANYIRWRSARCSGTAICMFGLLAILSTSLTIFVAVFPILAIAANG